MRHRDPVKFPNGQVDRTLSAPPPRIRVSRAGLGVSTLALVLIPRIEAFTIPLKFLLPSLIPKPFTIHDIYTRTLQLRTL